MNINHKLEIFRQIELILKHFAKMLLFNVIEPMANIDIEAVGLFIEENTPARYHGVIVLSVEDRRFVAFCFGTVVLFLPICLMQFPNSGFPVDEDGLIGINLLYTKESSISQVIPKDAHFGLPIVHKTSHDIHYLLVFITCCMVDSVVIFSHFIVLFSVQRYYFFLIYA